MRPPTTCPWREHRKGGERRRARGGAGWRGVRRLHEYTRAAGEERAPWRGGGARMGGGGRALACLASTATRRVRARARGSARRLASSHGPHVALLPTTARFDITTPGGITHISTGCVGACAAADGGTRGPRHVSLYTLDLQPRSPSADERATIERAHGQTLSDTQLQTHHTTLSRAAIIVSSEAWISGLCDHNTHVLNQRLSAL